ncbi:DUF2397 domain-containing protein [Kutzneria kofuensis]|uniref:Uncharacterized protein (TIGR02677 family) n=1 Tax=Kutzneria kofuensis TaxID=103725 RepID=A0A7W9KFE1_9PSEU|nr:DUF2397 domain-containing protein [Kutzneria kofuensis]MBB5891417.1 uncharacterized protein (TIGR02677 family) [Kutzneria kofuensis]
MGDSTGPGVGSPDTSRFEVTVTDSRRATAYLIAPEADEYIAIMAVLEASITDMMPAEIAQALREAGTPLDDRLVETRLDKLRDWTAASARTDTSRILRHADLLARNWRWTATPAGRQVQRFYSTVLADTPAMREIPLSSLARVVTALEALAAIVPAGIPETTDVAGADTVEHIGRLFISHDDLDAALVGAEDTLATLADRFDLGDEATSELKQLLVEYATRVAAELETGSARAHRALLTLVPYFEALADAAITASEARALIDRGALAASRGGRRSDWDGLVAWCDPATGRAARFALRLVRALPGMHANLRRLHASSSTATGRARALLLARACTDRTLGRAIFLAAVGDHPWRKLYDEADDDDLPRIPSWRDGPTVTVPDLLRATGRAGARGRPPAARDDTAARAEIDARRRERAAAHLDALREVLAASPGSPLSTAAARVALATLMAATRAPAGGPYRARRSAHRDGLACTLFHVPGQIAVLRAPAWRVWLPDRAMVFHPAGTRASTPPVTSPDTDTPVIMRVSSGGVA